MQFYCESLTEYKRLKTKEVKIGDLLLGNDHPIRVQTMTTTDTMDTMATVEQSIRCIEAGSELVRITAPSKNDAENLLHIKNELRKRGYHTPLVADIHFTPNAAEIAARIVEKVRINPGNYVDKKKFEFIEYTDADYLEEIERIRDRFTPLVRICREHGTAMRIGTNHGSLSDRIMSRYGDTAVGMVESAMEFLRIARAEDYHNIILSMKSSNPQVMVQAYRLLVQMMNAEFHELYPLHLGVTEAGDGEDGRIKSAIGIGTLLEDGIGDTIRVSLTEDPEFEVPVCKDLVKRYEKRTLGTRQPSTSNIQLPTSNLPYSPFEYKRRDTYTTSNIGGHHVPVVIADFMNAKSVRPQDLRVVGYDYDAGTDKWNIGDAAADYLYTAGKLLDFNLPGTLKVICDYQSWLDAPDKEKYYPLLQPSEYMSNKERSGIMNFIALDVTTSAAADIIPQLRRDRDAILCIYTSHVHAMPSVRAFIATLIEQGINCPVILAVESYDTTIDEQLIHFSVESGSLFLDGMGDGIWLINDPSKLQKTR